MSVFYDLNKTPRNILNRAIVRAIVSENNGAWFDPPDMSTLYQDAAGTIPVTAVEQPVGKILDKSGNGYHATQPITASRPTLSARKNILLATETLATQSVTTLAATYTLSVTGTGSVTLSGTATGTLTGTGTDRVSLTFTPTAGTLTLTVSGSVTKAQLGLGSVVTSYQRVTTATDYDVSAHYYFLRFDGVNDYLNLPYMGLYAGGSASVVMARDEKSTHSIETYTVAERSSVSVAPYYIFDVKPARLLSSGLIARNDALTTLTNTISASTNAISNAVVSSYVDTGKNVNRYRNSAPSTSTAYTRSGALSLTNTTIGAQVISTGPAGFINNNLYGLIITKSALTDSQRIACERYLGRKSGVTL